MLTESLEREIRDLLARTFAAGRREGERAAAHRVTKLVQQAAIAPAQPEATAQATPAAEESTPQHPSPGSDRLPPYWRPR